MYRNNKVRLIIGKIDTSTLFEVGVKKGDSVSLVLSLFLMMEFVETVEAEWDKHNIQKQNSNDIEIIHNQPDKSRVTQQRTSRRASCSTFSVCYMWTMERSCSYQDETLT